MSKSTRFVNPLLEPFTLRKVTFPSRVWISPMCQYGAIDGVPADWHFVHYGGLAIGKPGLIIAESTAISADGRISALCTGLYAESHVTEWRRIVDFCHAQDVLVGVQLSHAGRKASTKPPWDGEGDLLLSSGGWETVGPSVVPFGALRSPRPLSKAELNSKVDDFVQATILATEAGFDVIELHAAHGYLLHQFLSPISNVRADEYGGSLENRMRFPLEVTTAVRSTMDTEAPLFVRISATDWEVGGWNVEESIVFAEELKKIGVDLIDVSSGGLVPDGSIIPSNKDYQTSLSATIRHEANIATAAVGRIVDAMQANEVIADGKADAIFIARAALVNPHWPLLATEILGELAPWPVQYERAAGIAAKSDSYPRI